jgi:hypothetical protein
MTLKNKVRNFLTNSQNKSIDYFALSLLVMLIFSVYLIHFLNTPSFLSVGTDDNAAYVVSKYNLFELIKSQYFNWTGRLSGVILSYFSTNTFGVFYKLINPLFIFLCGYSISRYFSKPINVRHLLIALLCFSLISRPALGDAVFWYSGSYSYVVPISLILFCMIPYADSYFRGENKMSIPRFVLFAFTGIIGAMGQEQAAIVMVGVVVIFHTVKLIKKERLSPLFFVLTAILIAFTIIDIKSPGNANRWQVELIARFSTFDKLSIVAHIKLGLYCFFEEIVNHFTYTILALSGLIMYSFKKFIGKWRWAAIVFYAQFTVFVIAKVISTFLHTYKTGTGRLFNFNLMMESYELGTKTLLGQVSAFHIILGLTPFIFWSIFLALMITLIYKISEKPIFTLLCITASFVTMIVLYTSPTIFASGERPYFVSFIMFNIIIYLLIVKSKLFYNKIFILCFSSLFALKIGLILSNINLISH